jgi:hypothetical protein
LKERDVGGSNGGGGGGVERVNAWRGQWRHGGGGGGVEEKAVAGRLGDFNVRERHLCFVFLILFI